MLLILNVIDLLATDAGSSNITRLPSLWSVSLLLKVIIFFKKIASLLKTTYFPSSNVMAILEPTKLLEPLMAFHYMARLLALPANIRLS